MDNPYSPPEQLEDPVPESVASFSFKEAASVGWRRYREHFLLATGVAVVWSVLMLVATNSCIGLVVVPHLAAGWAVAGISLARNKPRFEAMFSSFESFGPIMAAGGLFALLYTVGFILVFLALLAVVFILTFWAEALSWKGLAESINGKDGNSTSEAFSFSIMGVGLVLLMVLSARFQLAFNLVLERKLPAIEAFKESWRITRTHSFSLGAFRVSFDLLLPALGLMCGCLPGILFALPLGLAMRGAASSMLLGNVPDSAVASAPLGDNSAPPAVPQASVGHPVYSPPPETQRPMLPEKRNDPNPYS